jgi:hypothetical protein
MASSNVGLPREKFFNSGTGNIGDFGYGNSGA